MTYTMAKKTVLVVVLGGLCFMFGWMYLGDAFSSLFNHPQAGAAMGGPPGPVMQEVRSLKQRIQNNPSDADAHSQLGDLYFEASMYDKALEQYADVVNINGQDVMARNNLAICDHLVGKDKDAFDQLDTALKISPGSQSLWLTLGVVSYETGNAQKAKEALSKAYQLNPSSDVGTKAKEYLTKIKSVGHG